MNLIAVIMIAVIMRAVIMRAVIMRAVNYAHHYHSMFEIEVYYYQEHIEPLARCTPAITRGIKRNLIL